jgi:hypothetical protein
MFGATSKGQSLKFACQIHLDLEIFTECSNLTQPSPTLTYLRYPILSISATISIIEAFGMMIIESNLGPVA